MSDEFQDIKEAVSRGRKILVQKFPRLMFEASQVTEQDAVILGTPKAKLQEIKLGESIAAYAKDIGEDAIEMLISYGAESPAEADRLIAKQRAQLAKAMGM